METIFREGGTVQRMPLKPSLEGWKPFVDPVLILSASALKPSLEGWKPDIYLSGFGMNAALKPSLEGWKHEY